MTLLVSFQNETATDGKLPFWGKTRCGFRGLAAPQVSAHSGVYFCMEGSSDEDVSLSVLQSVRCLECGGMYAKPTRGGTAQLNPGCPECGYVGWVSANVPVRIPSERLQAFRPRTESRARFG